MEYQERVQAIHGVWREWPVSVVATGVPAPAYVRNRLATHVGRAACTRRAADVVDARAPMEALIVAVGASEALKFETMQA